MRLKAEQIASRLKNNGLDPVYIISGDEPLQLLECADTIRMYAKNNRFDERIIYEANRDFDWNSLLADAANISLFSSRRLIDLRLPDGKPGREGSAVLTEYAASPPADTVLIISSARLDKQSQKSKWYASLDKIGICVSVRPIETEKLPGWIQHRGKLQGKSISRTAAEFIAQQVEGNLLAAKQEIDKLCLLVNGNNIGLDDAANTISDATRFNVFTLIESAMNNDLDRTRRMLHSLKNEGVDVAAIYGVLMWELRRLCSVAFQARNGMSLEAIYKQQRIWDHKRKAAIKHTLKQNTLEKIYQLLRAGILIDRQIKSDDRDRVWDSLQSLLFAMAGTAIIIEPVNSINN